MSAPPPLQTHLEEDKTFVLLDDDDDDDEDEDVEEDGEEGKDDFLEDDAETDLHDVKGWGGGVGVSALPCVRIGNFPPTPSNLNFWPQGQRGERLHRREGGRVRLAGGDRVQHGVSRLAEI